MRSGLLRHYVNIEYPQGAPDGYGNTLTTWNTLYTNIPAQIVVANVANEMWVGEKVQSQGAFKIYTRYLPNIADNMRFKWNGRIFNISSFSNQDERNISLQFNVREVIALANTVTLRTISGVARIS
jgi:SPP1 family predicted phage head-tail adaptor